MDPCYAIRNGVIAAFGTDVLILSCWVHVIRKCKNSSKLIHSSYITEIVKHVTIMHKSSTLGQFISISSACIEEWKRLGEANYADWFQSTYLDIRWIT